jgi:hypothetical protein
VREVEADPTSVVRLGSLKVTLDEAALIDRLTVGADGPIAAANEYRKRHRDEYAGHYLDRSGTLNILVSGHVQDHEAALELLFGSVPVVVREVRWSERELQDFRRELRNPDFEQWRTQQGLRITGNGIDVSQNRVFVEVATPATDEDVARRTIERLDGEDWLSVEIVVTDPKWRGGHGDLTVRLIHPNGDKVDEALVVLKADTRGALEQTPFCDIEPHQDESVCRWEGIGATTYAVRVWSSFEEDFLGATSAEVKPGEEVEVTVVVPTGG